MFIPEVDTTRLFHLSFAARAICIQKKVILMWFKSKGKGYPRTGHEGPQGRRGIAPLFL